MFGNNVEAITKQFTKLLGKLDKVEVINLQKISDSQAIIRAANDYIAEKQVEVDKARKIAKNVRKLIGEE